MTDNNEDDFKASSGNSTDQSTLPILVTFSFICAELSCVLFGSRNLHKKNAQESTRQTLNKNLYKSTCRPTSFW